MRVYCFVQHILFNCQLLRLSVIMTYFSCSLELHYTQFLLYLSQSANNFHDHWHLLLKNPFAFHVGTVEEPCDLGCDGLNYCTVFNNRPTELFRSCSPQTDDAAHYDVTLWRQRGTITLFNYELPLKNITKCLPDSWKAVACILQIRPCTRQSHVNKICRQVEYFTSAALSIGNRHIIGYYYVGSGETRVKRFE